MILTWFSLSLFFFLSLSVSSQFHRKRRERNVERKGKRRERSDENMFVVSKPISSSFLILSLDTFAGHWSVTIKFVCSWVYFPFSDFSFSLSFSYFSLSLSYSSLFSLSLFHFFLSWFQGFFQFQSSSKGYCHHQLIKSTYISLFLSFSFSIFLWYNPIFDSFMILIHYLQTLRRKSNPFHCFFNFTFSLNFFLFLSLLLTYTHSLSHSPSFTFWVSVLLMKGELFLLSLGCHVSSFCQLHSHSLSQSLLPCLLSPDDIFSKAKKRESEKERGERKGEKIIFLLATWKLERVLLTWGTLYGNHKVFFEPLLLLLSIFRISKLEGVERVWRRENGEKKEI